MGTVCAASGARVHDGSTSLFPITLYDDSQMAERSRIARTKVLHIECDNEIIVSVGLTASSKACSIVGQWRVGSSSKATLSKGTVNASMSNILVTSGNLAMITCKSRDSKPECKER